MSSVQTQTILRPKIASISVGICATSEVENTRLLADHVLDLNDSQIRLSEVIIVTPNRQLADSLEGKDPRILVEFESKREGKAFAINKIIERASGEILVLVSADVRLARSTILKLVGGLVSNPEWGAVDSKVELVNGDELFMDRVSNVLWDVHNSTLDELDGNDRLGHVAGDLFAIRRHLVDPLPRVINDDAYLALSVQQHGFMVKRIQEAQAWIAGPRTPTDYVVQRSRIIQGHLQLIKLFGKIPTTFEFQTIRRPRKYLELLVTVVARLGPSHVLPMLVAGFLEFLSLQVALFSSVTRRDVVLWRTAETTKRV